MTPRNSRTCRRRRGSRAATFLLLPALFAGCSGARPPASPPPALLGRERVSEIVNGYAAGNRAFGYHSWEAAADGFTRTCYWVGSTALNTLSSAA